MSSLFDSREVNKPSFHRIASIQMNINSSQNGHTPTHCYHGSWPGVSGSGEVSGRPSVVHIDAVPGHLPSAQGFHIHTSLCCKDDAWLSCGSDMSSTTRRSSFCRRKSSRLSFVNTLTTILTTTPVMFAIYTLKTGEEIFWDWENFSLEQIGSLNKFDQKYFPYKRCDVIG